MITEEISLRTSPIAPRTIRPGEARARKFAADVPAQPAVRSAASVAAGRSSAAKGVKSRRERDVITAVAGRRRSPFATRLPLSS